MSHQKILQFFLIFIFLFSLNVIAQQDFIDFESDQWDRTGAEIVQFMNRKCLIGSAFLKDVEFENGIIEIDIAVTG